MDVWKRTPVATCEALVNSMPKRVKAVLENIDGHTKYWHFGPIWTFSLSGVLTFEANGLDMNGCAKARIVRFIYLYFVLFIFDNFISKLWDVYWGNICFALFQGGKGLW